MAGIDDSNTGGTRSRYLVVKHPGTVGWSGTPRQVLEFRQDLDSLPVDATFAWGTGPLVFNHEARSVQVPFTYSGDAPVLSDFTETTPWLSFTQVSTTTATEGVLYVTLAANNTGSSRTAEITHTLPGTDISVSRTINQTGVAFQFNFTPATALTLDECGGSNQVSFSWEGTLPPVESSLDIGANWLTIAPGSFTTSTGGSGTAGTGTFTIEYAAQTANQSRITSITYTGTAAANNNTTRNFNQSPCSIDPNDPDTPR
jgi:hypothetical protein